MKDSNTLDTTIDEWRAELIDLYAGDPGESIAELCEKYLIPENTLKRRLKKLIKEGKCTKGMGTRTGRNGRRFHPAVYQLITKKEESEQ